MQTKFYIRHSRKSVIFLDHIHPDEDVSLASEDEESKSASDIPVDTLKALKASETQHNLRRAN